MAPRIARDARRRGGAALVELSIALLVLWMLFAAILEFGRMLLVGQMLQSAARAAARAVSLDDRFGAETDFETALDSIFDPTWLVLDLDRLASCGAFEPYAASDERALDQFFARLPLLNQMLRPVMIREDAATGTGDPSGLQPLLRYPGTLLRRTDAPSDPCASAFSVAIPALQEDRLRWLPIVEELPGADGGSRFPLSGGGLTALRINYPHQAVLWTATRTGDYGGVIAADTPVLEDNGGERGGELIAERDALRGPYAGRFGLGVQELLSEHVRPYARVLRGQAIFPREVVQP